MKLGEKLVGNLYKSCLYNGVKFSLRTEGKFDNSCVKIRQLDGTYKLGIIEQITLEESNNVILKIRKLCFLHTPFKTQSLTSSIGYYSVSSEFTVVNLMYLEKAFLLNYVSEDNFAVVSKFNSSHLFK